MRHNRWYLVALVLLIPAAVAVALLPRWMPYQASRPHPDRVALGETVRYSGADIQLAALEVLDGEALNAPVGADVVVATLKVDVVEPPESAYCRILLVSTEHGLERTWESEISSSSDFDIDESFAQLCSLSEKGAYDLQVTFLVPAGQVAEPIVEFSSSASLPRVLRLS